MKLRRASGEAGRKAQAGHLLLEWLIASALGLFVLAGALVLYRAQRESFARAADAAQMREAGSTALTLIGQHIQMAGYAPLDQPALRATVTPGLFGCQSARPVIGTAGLESGCESARSDRPNSDGLIVRYADDGIATWPNASHEPTDCLGQGVGRAGDHAVVVNRFYAAHSPRREQPELYCAGNGRPSAPQPLVEGIDRMVLRYWLRGAEAPMRAGALTPMQWADVIAVDLCVVVRGQRLSGASTFIDCDGSARSPTDGRQRLSLSRHLVLRNREVGAP